MCNEEKTTVRWSFVCKRWWSAKLLPVFLLLSACGVTTSTIASTISPDNTATAIMPTKVGLTATLISPSPRPSTPTTYQKACNVHVAEFDNETQIDGTVVYTRDATQQTLWITDAAFDFTEELLTMDTHTKISISPDSSKILLIQD